MKSFNYALLFVLMQQNTDTFFSYSVRNYNGMPSEIRTKDNLRTKDNHGLDANSCFWLVNILFQEFDTSSKEEMEMIKAQILRWKTKRST